MAISCAGPADDLILLEVFDMSEKKEVGWLPARIIAKIVRMYFITDTDFAINVDNTALLNCLINSFA